MVVTFATMLWPWGGRLLGTLTWPLVWWSNATAELISKWEWGTITLSLGASITIAVVVVLAVLILILRGYFVKKSMSMNWFYIGLVALVISVLAFTTFSRRPDGRLHLWLVRAGDGSTLYLRGPQGNTLLIDPAGSPGQLAAVVSDSVSPWDVHVDGVLLTNRASAGDIDLLSAQLPLQQAILTLPVSRLDNDLAPVTLPASMAVKQLAAGEVIQMEMDLTITPIAEDGSRTALLIEYGNTRVLVPGGVDPALLVAQQADNLSSLSILILNEEDVSNLPPDMWGNLGAQVILWNSPAVKPLPGWIGFEAGDIVEVVSDGYGYTVK
jgi:hypothetical protein